MRAVAFTHGDPSNIEMCGRPVTARFDTNDPERVVGWTCLLHGELTERIDLIVGNAVQHPNTGMFGVSPAIDEQVRAIFNELREGIRTVVEELRQDAFPPMMATATLEDIEGIRNYRGLLPSIEEGTRISRREVIIDGTFNPDLHLLCQVCSSVSGQQCLLEEGHAEWRPTRFHKFATPDPTPVTGSAESEPDVTFRQRRRE